MSRTRCYLEWDPWGEDRVMGLNHQMSSLSCALGEAHYLNRTLLFPDRLCIEARHERWRGPFMLCASLLSTSMKRL